MSIELFPYGGHTFYHLLCQFICIVLLALVMFESEIYAFCLYAGV